MPLVQRTKHSHSGVWTLTADLLEGGTSYSFMTGIRLVAKNGSYDSALDQCRAFLRLDPTTKIGVPNIGDPELSAVNGLLGITITNTAPAGNREGGYISVEYLHSARR